MVPSAALATRDTFERSQMEFNTVTFMAVLAVILALTSVGLVRDGGDGSIIVLNRVCFH